MICFCFFFVFLATYILALAFSFICFISFPDLLFSLHSDHYTVIPFVQKLLLSIPSRSLFLNAYLSGILYHTDASPFTKLIDIPAAVGTVLVLFSLFLSLFYIPSYILFKPRGTYPFKSFYILLPVKVFLHFALFQVLYRFFCCICDFIMYPSICPCLRDVPVFWFSETRVRVGANTEAPHTARERTFSAVSFVHSNVIMLCN